MADVNVVLQMVANAAMATLLGATGRMLALASSSNRPSGWGLLWELPLAWGMGVVGTGVADWVGVTGTTRYAVVIGIAYAGPRILDLILETYAKSNKGLTRGSPPESDKK